MRIALFQSRTGIDPSANAAALTDACERAAAGGAAMLFTPEMSGLLDRDARRAADYVVAEEDDIVLQAVRRSARDLRIWVQLGSLAVRRPDAKLVVLHLGNGASACAVDAGRSVATSMGLTPLEGLVMGTRGGDLDPGALLHLARQGMGPDELDDLLNRRSGLAGLTGIYYSLTYLGFALPVLLAALAQLIAYPWLLAALAVLCLACAGVVARNVSPR